MLKGGGLSRFKGKRQGLIVDDRSCDASVLIPLDVSIQRLDGGAYERFGFLSTVLPLGQFQEEAAFGDEGIGEALSQGPAAVSAVFDVSAESDAVGFPFTADRIDVVYSSRVQAGANVLLNKASAGDTAELMSLLPVGVGQAVLMAPATPGDPCVVRTVTANTPSTAVTPSAAVMCSGGSSGISVGSGTSMPASLAMLAAVAAHPEAGSLMFPVDDGQNEVAMLWTDEETRRPMRAKLDRWLPVLQLAPELKTTEHTLSMRQQQALWWRFGYHRKAAIYLDGLLAITGKTHAMPFVFVTVHATHPRVWVRWAQIDDPAVMIGRREYRQALRDIAACEASGEWREPFELETGRPLELPAWVVNEAIGGAALAGVEGA